MTHGRAILFLDTLEVKTFQCDLLPPDHRQQFDKAVARARQADRPHVLLRYAQHRRRARPCWLVEQTKY
jgi:hypothetical protein